MGIDYLDSFESYDGFVHQKSLRPSGQPILKPKPEAKAVYKTTHEIDSADMELLSAQTFETMLRNTVRASDEFSDDDIEWCRDNCTDLWSHVDSDLIRFFSKEDMTLFMVARS